MKGSEMAAAGTGTAALGSGTGLGAAVAGISQLRGGTPTPLAHTGISIALLVAIGLAFAIVGFLMTRARAACDTVDT